MGRYANDAPRIDPQCNAEVLHMFVDYRPYLVLLARRFIPAGEEIRYDYGVKNLPWRQTEVMIIWKVVVLCPVEVKFKTI